MAKHLDDLDYYALLGVQRDASVDDIKTAFHRFARRYHPDRFAGDPKKVSRNTRIYRRGTEAYRVLTQYERRRAYDAGLTRGQLRYDPETVSSQRGSAVPPQQTAVKASTRTFVARANVALRQGDYRQAHLQLKVALARDPDNAELKRMIAEIEAKLS